MAILQRLLVAFHVRVFRATGGRVMGRLGKGPILLLTTKGRASGKLRTMPLIYVQDGEALVVVGSYGGSPKHPAWYRNLQKDPTCDVQTRDMKARMRAEDVPPGPERERLWQEFVAVWRSYDGSVQQRTSSGVSNHRPPACCSQEGNPCRVKT